MWPFKKLGPVDAEPTIQDLRNEMIAKLQARFPIGSEFRYLGRTLIVTGHWEDSVNLYHFHLARLPKLRADYADDHGVLHSITLDAVEAIALAVDGGAAKHGVEIDRRISLMQPKGD